MGIHLLFSILRLFFKSNIEIALENIALRSQLALFQEQTVNQKRPKPRVTNWFRKLWIFLSKNLNNWKNTLVLVKPETVIGWHRRAFKFYWRRKSKGGRPKISYETIALIKRIHKENPILSPEKIRERMIALNIVDAPAPNTIAKYIHPKRKEPTQRQKQSWKAFLQNHADVLWSMDFAVATTLNFKVLYVLLIISHERRKIEHFAVTEQPYAQWMVQQTRNATPFGHQPDYLLHDNDPVFTAVVFQEFLSRQGIKSKRISPRSPWQNGICERLVGIVRRELLDYIVPLNEQHLTVLLKEYVDYYNNVRTHQFLDGETPVHFIRPQKTCINDARLNAKPILNGLYHQYDKIVA